MATGANGEQRIVASDGLIAREAGEYAKRKLAFIDQYCDIAIDATRKKLTRGYIDLFAGPGLNVIRETGEEVSGAALRVLTRRGRQNQQVSFDAAHLVNIVPAEHEALRQRVERLVSDGRCMVPPGNIHTELGDANELLPRLLAQFNPKAFVLVFADIEGPSQLPWSTVESLTRYGHSSIDLYCLFPLEMGLNRLMPYGRMSAGNERIITAFFGHEQWRPILAGRVTDSRRAECQRRLEELYVNGLQRHWRHAVKLFNVSLTGRHGLYRMLFASNHDAGKGIAEWAKRQAEGLDQGEFAF